MLSSHAVYKPVLAIILAIVLLNQPCQNVCHSTLHPCADRLCLRVSLSHCWFVDRVSLTALPIMRVSAPRTRLPALATTLNWNRPFLTMARATWRGCCTHSLRQTARFLTTSGYFTIIMWAPNGKMYWHALQTTIWTAVRRAQMQLELTIGIKSSSGLIRRC